MIPTFTFFAVDKGNMTLVQFTNGVNMLIDCRLSSTRQSPLEYIQSKVKSLDFVVITHPHQDHLTGLKEVCETFKPKYLWHNGRYFRPDPVYDDWNYYEKLRKGQVTFCKPVKIQNGQVATFGNSKILIAGPPNPYLDGTPDDENNNGIILSITTENAKVVLTGDTEAEQWATVELKDLANAAVLLASHHGRDDGYSEETMNVIKPQLVVISDGRPAETDATEKYKKFAKVSTTRDNSITLRPKLGLTSEVVS